MRTKEITIGTIQEWLDNNVSIADIIIAKNSDINVNYDDWYEGGS